MWARARPPQLPANPLTALASVANRYAMPRLLPRALASSALALAFLLIACPGPKESKKTTSPGSATATSTHAGIELPSGDGPVASVNGVPIPRAAFNKEYIATLERYQRGRHEVQPALRERVKDTIVHRLIDAEEIRQQAEQMGIKITPEERAQKWQEHRGRYGSGEAFKAYLERAGTTEADVREQFEANMVREKLFDHIADRVEVKDDEVKDFYEKNKARYDEPEQVEASQILIKVPEHATAKEKAALRKKAEDILHQAKAKPGEFAQLAQKYSEDPARASGGQLGYFTRGRMQPPFEKAVWPLKVGQVSGLIETSYGFHVAKKTGHRPEVKKTYEEVADTIRKSLLAKKRSDAIRDAIQKWKQEAKVEIFLKADEAIMRASTPVAPPMGGIAHPVGQIAPQPMAPPSPGPSAQPAPGAAPRPALPTPSPPAPAGGGALQATPGGTTHP